MKHYDDSAEAAELRAEARGMGTRYAGFFPELPLPAAPVLTAEQAEAMRLRAELKQAAIDARKRSSDAAKRWHAERMRQWRESRGG